MKVKALIKLTRPKFQIPSIVSYLIGISLAFFLNQTFQLPLPEFLAGLLLMGPFIGGGSLAVNQYFDYQLDQTSKKGSPLVDLDLERRSALAAGCVLLLLGLSVAAFINYQVLGVTCVALFICFAYHVPPIRLKGVRYLDSISNGVAYSYLPILVALSVFNSVGWETFLIPLPFFLGFTGGHMLLALPDIESDRKFKVHSTASVLGFEKTVLLSLFIFVAMFALAPLEIFLGLYPLTALLSLLLAPYIFLQLLKLKENRQKLRDRFKKLRGGFLLTSFLFIGSVLISTLAL